MPVFEDLTGKQFGMLKILYRAEDYIQPSGQHKRMWHCVCNCGKECNIRANDLKSGNTTSCGCQSSRNKSIRLEDLTRKVFGDFMVINRASNKVTPSGQQTRRWHCKCSRCGIERDIQATQLKNFSGRCSCNKSEKVFRELKGEVFGNLTVERLEKEVNGHRYWLCRCACGTEEVSVEEYRLISGKKTSCGCLNKIKRQEKQKEKILKSKKSLLIDNPQLAIEWHPLKNGNLHSNEVTSNCNIKVWWLGKCGHEWQATVGSRNRGNGCPICSNRQTLQGFNDIATLYPELLNEWDFEKNDTLPTMVSSLNTIVWWKCNLGHSYDMKIALKVGKQKCGCPYCCVPAKKILKGFNDLETTHSHILTEWDYEKNEMLPEEISSGSAKKVWWKCKKGHSFQQSIVYKTKSNLKSTCPYCSHQKLLSGYNDLATTHPYILTEWDYDKNTLLPTEIGVGTHEKIWWKCPFGHSYQTYPSNRCGKQHTGCPVCDKENHTSFPEQAMLYYVKKYFPDAINSDREQIGMELDIYIPQINIAIEYDGKMWHNNNAYESKKNKICKEKGILLIRIREDGLKNYDDCICLSRKEVRSNKSLSDVIVELLKLIGNIESDVDVERDESVIYSSYIETRKAKSLASQYPDIANEWHPTKNGNLTAMMVAPLTNKKVWWLSKCGHEYQMKVCHRTNQNCGCPYCAGKRVLVGFHDLKTLYPELLSEWDFERNIDFSPAEVLPHSDKKAWWICKECGNSWLTKIDSRTRMRTGCPKCGQKMVNRVHFKAVRNIDTGETFESIKDAGERMGINSACIGNVCRGKQKKAGGYHWEYCENK